MELLANQYEYPVNGAAGIVGNLIAESGVLPNRIEGSRMATPIRALDFAGRVRDFTPEEIRDRDFSQKRGPRRPGTGLAQWTSPNRREGLFCHIFRGQQLGTAILFDLDAQVDYLVTELHQSPINSTLVAPSVTLNDAADDIVYRFEIPGSVLQNRRRLPRSDSRVQKVFAERRAHAQRASRNYRTAHPETRRHYTAQLRVFQQDDDGEDRQQRYEQIPPVQEQAHQTNREPDEVGYGWHECCGRTCCGRRWNRPPSTSMAYLPAATFDTTSPVVIVQCGLGAPSTPQADQRGRSRNWARATNWSRSPGAARIWLTGAVRSDRRMNTPLQVPVSGERRARSATVAVRSPRRTCWARSRRNSQHPTSPSMTATKSMPLRRSR
jgi:hypothetical protein